MANRDPVRQKRGKAKKPIPDALLSGSAYDYQDEDVQSTMAVAGSQDAFGEQHNTTVVPQTPSGETKATEGFVGNGSSIRFVEFLYFTLNNNTTININTDKE